ncbi:unnamed protein product [Chironomus riparius]|uniref:C-type lectin domain-containing protein n=1 Tax=Chironomus riparius TaxID=315576 RepID=A0A9P0JFA0_9DIPT|nr:unnamed protein product [Chironomus riparius]
MGEKSYSLEKPSSSSPKSTNGYLKAISIIIAIFAVIFAGYYFFLLPYHDDSDLDDIFSYATNTPASPMDITSTTDIPIEYEVEISIEEDQVLTGIDEYFNYDYIGTTIQPTESSLESEEFLTYEYPDNPSFPEGSGDDDGPIEFEDEIPNCSKFFKIPESNKIVCLVEAPKTPKDAAQFCKSAGMKFLKITDDEMKQKVFDGTRKIFGIGGGTALWIDGKWNENKRIWDSWHDGSKVEVYPVERMLGDCTRIFSPLSRKYEISSSKCELTSYFYCEKLIKK